MKLGPQKLHLVFILHRFTLVERYGYFQSWYCHKRISSSYTTDSYTPHVWEYSSSTFLTCHNYSWKIYSTLNGGSQATKSM